MTTLYDVLYTIYDLLGQLEGGSASDGGATTCVTTDEWWKDLDNDRFNRGIIFLPADSVYAKITDFAATGTAATFTFATLPDSLEVTAADVFAAADRNYPMDDVIRKINLVLRTNRVPKEDTSLTTIAGQTAYDVPAAAKGQVKQVWIRQENSTTDPHPMPDTTWYIRQGPATEQIVFRKEPASGKTIWIKYMGAPDAVSDYDDTIDSGFPLALLAAMVMFELAREQWQKSHGENEQDALEEAGVYLRNVRRNHRIARVSKHTRSLLGKR